MNIREAFAKFATDEQCLDYIRQMRWSDGIVLCTKCDSANVKRMERTKESKNKRSWFYYCIDCHNQFSPTSGTLFQDTHLPLIVWFQAIAIMLNAKKGISAKQLQRDLGIGGYKTAWYLNHRIREAMKEGDIPMLGGIVEIDETYVGGKTIRRKDRGKYREKDAVVGMIERGGRLRFRHIGKGAASSAKVGPLIQKNVASDAEIMTDESTIYNFALSHEQHQKHQTIQHKTEYVRGEVHTNTIESAFSLLKRGIVGSFHKVSIKHLSRYLAEFEYRFNRRNEDAFIETVRRLCGFEPLPFTSLISEPKA